MESLNRCYEDVRFHNELVELTGATTNSHVLDVGCGAGKTLRSLLETGAQVVGLDYKDEPLEAAYNAFEAAVTGKRLELLRVDLNNEAIPFPDTNFDIIICQNVLECIEDKQQLIADCFRCLKADGVFMLAHHDYGGVMINSSKSTLTRTIVAAYADETQNWMKVSDGEIGRKLPALTRSSSFSRMTTETRQFVDLSFGEGTYARSYCQDAAHAALRAGISKNDTREWLCELEEKDQQGSFYFSVPWIYVKAVK